VSDLIQIALVFARLTFVAFGGGIGILPEMEKLVVGQHHWVTHQEFVDAYALSQVTPGPGMLMVVAIGFRAAGVPGAIVAGVAMFSPPAALTWFVADRWARVSQRPFMLTIRATLAPVALGLLVSGSYTLLRLAVDGWLRALVAVAAFVALATFGRAPWQVVAAGAVFGTLALR
jgi:chromate transporter